MPPGLPPDPINGAGAYSPGNWLTERLPLLHPLGLVLLPGGPNKRPTVGDGWPDHPGLSIQQLQAAAPPCVCWHVGAEGCPFVAIDLDGLRAIAHCEAHGCFPLDVATWRIERTSTRERLKLVFRVSDPAVRQRLVDMRKTTRIGKRSGGPADPGDEFALFARPGTQIVALGNHYDKAGQHDDQYAWAGVLPHQTIEIPPEWLALLIGTLEGDQPLVPRPPAPPPSAVVPLPFQAPTATATDADKARACLAVLPVMEHSYDDWIQVGMALHSVGDDSLLADWDRWSAGDPGKYEKGACERKWRSFKPGGGRTIASLVHWAKAHGLRFSRPPAERPAEDYIPADAPTVVPFPPAAAEPPDEDAEATAAAIADLQGADAIRISLADVLPLSIAAPLTTRAAAFPCDPLFFLLPVLCTVAGIVGRRLEVQAKRGFTQPLVLWGANVAVPGSMKSPAAKVISGPLYRLQKQLIRKAKDDLAAWEREKDRQEEGHKDNPEFMLQWLAENPQPTLRRVVVGDATIERIGQYFTADATHGLVAFHDELSKWFDNLQRGGKDAKSDSHNWCEGYDAGTLDVGRVGRGDVFIPDCPISLFGSIQPEKMIAAREAAASRNNKNPDGDGLLGRFVMVLPWRAPWRYNDLEADVSDLLLTLFREQIEAVIPPMGVTGDGDLIPTRLTFHPQALREVIVPHLHALSDLGAAASGERAQWLDKARGRVLRLAGLLHVIQQAVKEPAAKVTEPIDVETARRAVLLSAYFLAQYELAMAEFGAGPEALPADVAKLLAKGLEWRRQHGTAPVTMSQLRDWCLPAESKDMKPSQRRAWVAAAVAAHPGLGQMVPGHKGDNWLPPAP